MSPVVVIRPGTALPLSRQSNTSAMTTASASGTKARLGTSVSSGPTSTAFHEPRVTLNSC